MEAANEIMEGSGKRYDPKIVEAFRKALPLMKKVREAYNDSLGDMINLDFSPAKPAALKTVRK
jgi:HD-GYP domain-containing protein (c-di-GMP phosphodiesterase class II)